MAFTSGFTAVTGATYTAAQYNTNVRDNFAAIWVFTTAGDLIYASGATTAARLPIGADGKFLSVVAGLPAWISVPGGISLEDVYPVGCIYTSVVSTNPATVFGFGTWAAFGAGKTLVGLDAGQTEFDTVEETGGAKDHTLTVPEMPVHTHVQPAHSHSIGVVPGNFRDGTSSMDSRAVSGSTNTGSTTATNQNTGGGSAHNNLQPYIVVYFWKRTA